MLGSAGSSQVVVLVLTLLLKKRTTGDESTHSRERGTGLHSGSALCSSAFQLQWRFPAQTPMAPKFSAWVLTLGAIYPKICQLIAEMLNDCRNDKFMWSKYVSKSIFVQGHTVNQRVESKVKSLPRSS